MHASVHSRNSLMILHLSLWKPEVHWSKTGKGYEEVQILQAVQPQATNENYILLHGALFFGVIHSMYHCIVENGLIKKKEGQKVSGDYLIH